MSAISKLFPWCSHTPVREGGSKSEGRKALEHVITAFTFALFFAVVIGLSAYVLTGNDVKWGFTACFAGGGLTFAAVYPLLRLKQ
jgi:hypothetical protein